MAPRVSAHEEYGYVRIQYQDEIFLSVMICPNHQIGQTHLKINTSQHTLWTRSMHLIIPIKL